MKRASLQRTDGGPVLEYRIGEAAEMHGITTRTLRYWEELGLVTPSLQRPHGERRYSAADLARVRRIRDLQELLGFSLAEVRVVLDTEDVDVLDRVRSELHSGEPSVARQRELLDEAAAANDQLLARLDETVSRIEAFRAERVGVAQRLRERRAALEAGGATGEATGAGGGKTEATASSEEPSPAGTSK